MDQPPRIGRYCLVRRVGAGGFATVWLAYDEQLDAEVAVKILSDNWIDEHDVRQRFLAEGRFLRRVDSPHVVGVHDVGETADGRPYLVLTYADGGSLADRLKSGPLEVAKVVEVIRQVGSGLKQLHARGVLHRDVKPGNVLFRSDPPGERAMLGDLGLGKSLETVSQLTLPGGTPAYVAPEQAMGERLDQRADLYSLGAVAYAAFTGRAPHGVASLGAVMGIEGPPPPMATLRAEIPAALDAVVRRALEPDRDRRWGDLSTFLTALRTAHETGELPPELGPLPTSGLLARGAAPRGATASGATARSVTARGDTARGAAASGATASGAAASGMTVSGGTADAAARTVTAAGVGGEQQTALSSATAAPTPSSSNANSVAAGDRARRAAAEPDGRDTRRSQGRRRARVVAGLTAVVLAGGGGLAGYELVSRRPVEVQDQDGRLSVRAPRSWTQKSDNGWVPPGRSRQPGLLVTTDTEAWGSVGAPGVFAGILPETTLPTTVGAPSGCRPLGGAPDGRAVGGRAAVTFRFGCGGDTSVVERFIRVADQELLRIQVRSDSTEQTDDVLDSVTHRPR